MSAVGAGTGHWWLLWLLYFAAVLEDRTMSRSIGAHTADPCPWCRVEEVRLGSLVSFTGRDVVGYVCGQCGNDWCRPVEDDLEAYDIVRADLPGGTIYGEVWKAEDDRVQVRGTSGEGLLWVERWRVILY